MRIFITGGTGYLGRVLVERMLGAGHEVEALARSTESAVRLERAGAIPVPGSLADTGVLTDAAARADAVVHAAVDYSMTEEANAVELAAVAALAEGAGRGGRATPVVYTSTGLVYGFAPDRRMDEDAELPEVSAQPVKAAGERILLDAPGITPIVIRAGLIFGRGGSGLITGLIGAAAATGAATYLGDGENSWVPVHVDDLADLYLRAVEAPVAGIYNAAGTVPFTFRELAEAVGSLTGTPAVSVPPEVAVEKMGPAAQVLGTTSSLDGTKARRVFGWAPEPRSLVADVAAGSYAAPA